jgi:hypothetical protein
MPFVIHCPMCSFAGESRDPEEVFYLGHGTIEGRPARVRECKVCGATLARRSGFFAFLRRWELVRPERSQGSWLDPQHYQPPVDPDANRKPLAKLAEVEEEIRRRKKER